jgi:UDPglucose 6-dehydrogenase
MRLAVIGSGYVGLVASVCFAELGHEVICVDNDLRKLQALERGEVPIHEQFLPELLGRHHGRGLQFSSSLGEAVRASAAAFIAVGTPPAEGGEADLSYVESVSREIARAIDRYTVVVEKSTVPVFTSEWIRKVMLQNGISPELFDVASNPEFLREGTAVTDFLYPDRIVVGADNERSASILREIYSPLADGSYGRRPSAVPSPRGESAAARLISTNTKSAELIKHASNAYLATKISFINAVSNLCEAVGADVNQVCQGIGSDSRIGPRFLNPGIGYGGSCFPKDLLAFHSVARECGYNFGLLDEVVRINEGQRHRFLRKVRNALWTLRGKRLAVLGLAFKAGTDDVRESPAIAIVQSLLREGCRIQAYDPAAMERAKEMLPENGLQYMESAYDAAQGADALLVLTEWPEFAQLELPRLKTLLVHPIVIDGRNLFDPQIMSAYGFFYHSIGRPEPVQVLQESSQV